MKFLPKEILIFSVVFGSLPLKYVGYSKIHKNLEFSLTAFTWGFILLVFQMSMSFIALYIDHTGKQAGEFIRMRSDTSTCVVFLDVITLNIMAIVSLVNSARNYPRFLKCLNTLQKYDYALRVKTKDQKIRRRVIFTVLLTTIFIVLCTIFFMSEYNNFAIYIPSLTLHCSQAAILLHFTHLCTVITQRFKVINDKIEKEITNSRSEIGRKIISKTKLDAGCSSSVQHFKFLTDLYWQLCLAVHQANTFYSSQLLAAMLSAFSHATIFLYYFIRNFRPEPVSNETMKAIILLLMVVIYNAHLVVILKSSTELTKTVNETAQILCRLNKRNMDQHLKEHLDLFLLQLMHHNAKFSAFGLFQINNRILVSVAGSATTYLVILIQTRDPSRAPS